MTQRHASLEVGFWVATTLAPGAAPLRSYVGQVEAVDTHGIRLTLIDWITGDATGYDLFVPWNQLQSALIATSAHDLQGFGREASGWQERVHALETGPNGQP